MKRSTQMSLQKFILLSCQISVRHKNIPTYASGSTRIQQHHRKKILETNKRSIPHTHTHKRCTNFISLSRRCLVKNSHTPATSQAHMLETNQKKKPTYTWLTQVYPALLPDFGEKSTHPTKSPQRANKLMQLLSLRLTSDSTTSQVNTYLTPTKISIPHTHMNYTN